MGRVRLPLLLALAVLGVMAGPTAAASGAVTLALDPATAVVGSTVTFTGSVSPAAVTHVEIYRQTGSGPVLLVAGDSRADGTYRLRAVVRLPGQVFARADGADSAPVDLRIKPLVQARFRGLAVVGAALSIQGRVRPAVAGTLRLTIRGHQRTVALDGEGRFRARVSTALAGRLAATLRLAPGTGFLSARRTVSRVVAAPTLGVGSRGPAVRFLERRLQEMHYALQGVSSGFGYDTRDAVFAFQKVTGLPVDGVVRPSVWRRLMRAHTPRAAIRRGDHIEVDKSRQVLFEVRKGKVARVIHVSTGATGNTPLGRWRVYRKTPGYNSLSMYYTLYFHGGFALHGYHSVPTFPASHGCVRLPIWFAPGLYSRWNMGATVYVLA
jgi:lipoprotein-anchoring transpeptidase ErfK/SrfK